MNPKMTQMMQAAFALHWTLRSCNTSISETNLHFAQSYGNQI